MDQIFKLCPFSKSAKILTTINIEYRCLDVYLLCHLFQLFKDAGELRSPILLVNLYGLKKKTNVLKKKRKPCSRTRYDEEP